MSLVSYQPGDRVQIRRNDAHVKPGSVGIVHRLHEETGLPIVDVEGRGRVALTFDSLAPLAQTRAPETEPASEANPEPVAEPLVKKRTMSEAQKQRIREGKARAKAERERRAADAAGETANASPEPPAVATSAPEPEPEPPAAVAVAERTEPAWMDRQLAREDDRRTLRAALRIALEREASAELLSGLCRLLEDVEGAA